MKAHLTFPSFGRPPVRRNAPCHRAIPIVLAALAAVLVIGGCADTSPVAPDTKPSFSGTVADQTYTVGKPISTLSLPAATGGNGDLSYTLQPTVRGLTFDLAARTVSGTPTTPGTYRMTYRVVDADENTEGSDAATLSFTITVQEAALRDTAPSFSGTMADQTYTVREPISTLTLPAATGGNGDLTYTLDPTVPGLTFDPAARTLSGTPTTVGTYGMTYRVVDADENTEDSDAATLGFTITVREPSPEYVGTWHFTDLPAPATAVLEEGRFTVIVGDRAAGIVPEAPFDQITRITATGTLAVQGSTFTLTVADDGIALTFAAGVTAEQKAASTESVTAMLTQADDAPVTVTIDDDVMTVRGGFVSTVLMMTELTAMPESAPSFEGTMTDQSFTVGEPIGTLTLPAVTGGNGPLAYTLEPHMPGLSFDANARTLSGTPTTAGTYQMTYRVVDADTNAADSDAATQVFTITVREADTAPMFEGTVQDRTYTAGEPIEDLTLPAATGGNGLLTYSLEPSVPGLSFDAEERTLSGTPTGAGTYGMTYTVADSDDNTGADDQETLTFTITVQRDPGDLFPGPNIFAEVTEFEAITISADGPPITVARNEILVYLGDDVSWQDYDAIAARIIELGGEIVGSVEELKTLQVRVPDAADELKIVENLGEYPGFDGGGLNLIWDTADDNRRSTSEDDVPEFPGNYWIEQIHAHTAWHYTLGSTASRAVIGVVDEGIPAFPTGGPFGSGRLIRYNNSGIAILDGITGGDRPWHGSFVACMAAANHGRGVGVARANNIVSVDVFDPNGKTSSTAVPEGIKHAVNRGARVVNVSIGPSDVGHLFQGLLQQYFRIVAAKAVLYAKKSDVLVVFGSGNSSYKADNEAFSLRTSIPFGTVPPRMLLEAQDAWSTHVLTVSAVDSASMEAAFSVMGDVVNIAAPGEYVGCGLHNFMSVSDRGRRTGSGTSYAAPLVAGTAALMRSADTSLTAPEVRSTILRTAQRNVELARGSRHPRVQLNACMALAAVKDDDYAGDTWPNFGMRMIDDVNYTVGKEIEPWILPEAICHNESLNYLLVDGEGQQVPGLDFSLVTRELSGTPTQPGTYRMTYTVVDIDTSRPEGVVTDSLTFTIQVTLEVPEMVVVPAGRFRMGAINDWSNDPDNDSWEYCVERARDVGRESCREFPRHWVSVPSFAVGVHEVTYAQWDACVADGGCDGYRPYDRSGRGDRPVTRVSWHDAQRYVAWLSAKTGEEYRLLSEAEWEYVARAGTTTRYHTGNTISTDQANFDGRHDLDGDDVEGGLDRRQTLPVGSFAPNAFGLYDVHGNVWEWVQDCWNDNYEGAPSDGSAWETGDCSRRVVRGGSWYLRPWFLRSAFRDGGFDSGFRSIYVGFRVARTLKS